MGDTELYMDRETGVVFEANKSLIEKAQNELNQILYDGKYEDLSINTILAEIADEVEKKTGKRPVFDPWSRNEVASFNIDENVLFIDWES